ncbi:aldehyde reductase [Amycolatopsis sp. FBCC-B4732]|uniref:SDR family oxidoreductase n=1 Tax=Amycolatopsis sp. FBCC-B4732 TaxID=3079339 RepID=UPI001FF615A5|nr:aldehyde reductase [Amycolatopsis sp. FBCC-B4732]UOX91017.1 aldehyde reductase [Amycolatopsis sp. FBCC-B4732]
MAEVLVTGGSGYIGSWCVLALLADGHTVRTTVRDLKKEPAVRAMLTAGGAPSDAKLTVLRADLEQDAGWREAVEGCDYVLHVASPTLTRVPKDDDEMVVPARDGVLRVLRAARGAGVKRVVLTSAFGAVGMGHPEKSRVFTEADWSDVDAGIPAYQKSKTLAEKAAWRFVDEHGGIELAVVNPVGVFGPVLGSDYSPSLGLVQRMLAGDLPALPKFAMGYVDVRDVADLHLRAMTDPAAAGERFLAISGHSLWVREIAAVLRERLGDRAAKVPTRELPVWTARALARINPGLRILGPQLGRNYDATSAKAQRVLGWSPRPIEDTIADTAESLLALKAA